MSTMQWVLSREPQPPPSLLARIERALGECPAAEQRIDGDEPAIAGHLIAAAVRILDGFEPSATSAPTAAPQPGEGSVRPAALGLLAADALITYAMESAADDCMAISSIADDALRIICSLGAPPLGHTPPTMNSAPER